MSSHYVLKIQYADGRPAETRKLDMAVAVIGRDSGDIVLGDSQASGRHAELRFANGRLTVRDDNSTNGTFFKGARTPSFEVGPGDSFTIGQTILTVMELTGGNDASASKGRTMMAMGGVPGRPPGPPPPGGARAGGPPPPMGGFRPPPPGGAPRPPGPPAAAPAAAPAGPPRPSGGASLPAPGGFTPAGPAAAAPSAAPSPAAAPVGPPPGLPGPGGAASPSPAGPALGAAAAAAVGTPPAQAFTPPAAAAAPAPAMGSTSGPALSGPVKLAIEPVMLPGESILHTLDGDGLYLGPGPFEKLVSIMSGAIIRILGGHIRINLVVSNQRVLVLQSLQFAFGIRKVKVVHSVSLASIVETGWSKGTEMCCINSRMVSVETKTQKHGFMVRKIADQPMRDFVTQLSAVAVSNAQAGTAT